MQTKTQISIAVALLIAAIPSFAEQPKCVAGEVWHIDAGLKTGQAIDAQVACIGNDFAIPMAKAKQLGLVESAIRSLANSKGLISLSALGKVSVDDALASIDIDVRPDLRPLTTINLGGFSLAMAPQELVSGGYVNYDLRAYATPDHRNSVKGLFDANTFVKDVALNAQFLANTNGSRKFERLSVNASKTDSEKMTTWSAGDSLSSGGDSVNPVRFTGIQFKKDFSSQPGFITQNSYDFSLSAASKSTVEILLDGRKIRSETVEAGPVSISSMMPLVGSTGAQIVVRDVFGAEQVISAQVVGDPDLLRHDLENYSIQAGKMRINSFKEDGYFASGFYRRGLSQNITAEINAEQSMPGNVLAAVGHVGLSVSAGTQIGNFSVSARAGSGSMTSATYQNVFRSTGWTTSIGANITKFDGYKIMGAALLSDVAPANKIDLSYRAAIQSDSGFSLSAFRVRSVSEKLSGSSNGFSLSYAKPGNSIMYSVSASKAKTVNGDNSSVFFGLSIPFGGSFFESADRTQSFFAGMQKDGLVNRTTLDYTNRTNTNSGMNFHAIGSALAQSVDANWLGTSSEFGIAAGTSKSVSPGLSAFVRGAIGFGEGHVGMMRTVLVFGGYALVDAGAPGVGVLLNNQAVGTTGKDGSLFVSGLMPYLKNSIGIDPEASPFNFDAMDVEVSTARRAGVKVKFEVISAVMLEMPTAKSGVISIDGNDYPITDRGVFIEGLSTGFHSGFIAKTNETISFNIPAAIPGTAIQKIKGQKL